MKFLVRLLFVMLAFFASTPTSAETASRYWPQQPLRILVGFPPGGIADSLARRTAQALTQSLGVATVVENRPGAGGLLASQACSRAPGDGYTFCIGSAPVHSLQPLLHPGRDGFDPNAALVPVLLYGSEPTLLVVNPAVPARSPAELVSWVRMRGPTPFGSSGVGTTAHLMGEMIARGLSIPLEHIPYRGSPPAVTAAISGEVPVLFIVAGGAISHIRENRLVALGVSSGERLTLLPEVPTLSESIMPSMNFSNYQGLFAPSSTPRHIIERVHAIAAEAFAAPATSQDFRDRGLDLNLLGPSDFSRWIHDSSERWRILVDVSGVKISN